MELFGTTGQERTAWKNELIENFLRKYLGPTGLPERGAVASNILNPVVGIEDAGAAGRNMLAPGARWQDRVSSAGNMLSEVAGAVAPVAAGRMAGLGADDMARMTTEAFTNVSARPSAVAAKDFGADQSGMFAGIGAKNADLGALERAKAMADTGADRDAIWSETGWFKGVDGKWRFEIDDQRARVRNRTDELALKKREGLSDSLEHDDLFDAYPDLAGIGLKPDYANAADAKGTYNAAKDEIGLSPFTLRDRGQTRSTLLHETQHAIQQREGFARGGNTNIAREIKNKADAKIAVINNRLSNIAEAKRRFELDGDAKGVISADVEYRKAMSEKEELIDQAIRPEFDIYQSIAGEVEARNVQTRRDIPPHRRGTPWSTQDVNDEYQIFRSGDGF